MTACPQCGATLFYTQPLGRTTWEEHCSACGHVGGGTVSFVIPDQPSLDRIVSGYFRLSRLDQYSALRQLLPSLSSSPSTQIIQTLKANDLRWPVSEMTWWQAKRNQSLAKERGFEFIVEGEETVGAS